MKSIKSAWLNLILAPIWFLLAIIIASIYFGAQGIEENSIPVKITENVPTIILCVQLLLLSTLYFSSRKDHFNIFKKNWHVPKNTSLVQEICFGGLTGISIAILYIFLLSPLQLFLQNSIGDYVPAGETMNALGKQTIIFFVANVIFAPFVEESLYRNYSLTLFLEQYSFQKAIALNTIFFGLLHWTGGFWYILMTAIFVGLPFAFITFKRKSIIWVFAAHLTLNLIEFVYIYLR